MKVEILQDTKFEHKIGLKGLSSAKTAHTIFGYLNWENAKEPHYWEVAEWASKYLMKDGYSCDKSDDSLKFFSESKHVTIFPGKGKAELFADTRKEYEKPREATDPWIHLLLEQAIPMDKRTKLCTLKNLFMELDFEIVKSDIHMDNKEYDPGKHASQASWYLTVENCACKELDFEGRPDYLWFGLPMFDNRFPEFGDTSIFLDYGTQKLIYAKRRDDFLPHIVEIGKPYRIFVDVLPEIKKAFDETKKQGWLKGAKWEDMAIGSTNIGWEIPGTFDVGLKINKISIMGETK